MAKFTLRMLAGLMFVVSVLILSQTSAQAQAIITKGSVTPTTYTGPGETLKFTFVFNSGSRVIANISMTDNFTGGAYSCTPSSVSTNANITCTYNYVTTISDSFAGGSVSDVPNYSYNSGLGGGSYNPSVLGQVVANYVAPPAPTVSSISPTSGPGNGGTAVTITGTNFVGVTGVSIGGSPATGIVVNSATQISAFTGTHAPAAGQEVDVSNGGGTNAPNTLFTYTAGTCSAGGSGTLSMSGTAVNTNQSFSIDTVLANPASVEGTSGVYFTCGADTSFYAPDQAGAPDAGGPITGSSGGVYNLAYDVTQQAADDAALRQPHYVIKVITPPPAGTDSLTLYYNGSALPDGNFGFAYKTFTLNLTNVVTGAPTLTANAGTTPQSARINTPFGTPLAVTVKDAGNNPQAGVNVTFTAPGTGASGIFNNSSTTITVATDGSGVASAPFTANATASGPYPVTAAAAGYTTVNFSLTNTPITMTANAGTTPQSATVNTAFTNSVAVTVMDLSSHPVPGINVTFTALGSGTSGTFSNSTATITVATDGSGIASAPFTANATAGGPYTVTASAAGVTTVNFSMTNTPGLPSTMTANAGTTPQSTTISTAFTNGLGVTVKDASSNPVPGINVTFTAPGSGVSGKFSNSTATITVATNASGIASAPFNANATAGGPYTVTAAAVGVTTVNFSMNNTPGAPSAMSANAGTTPQSATISTAFTNPVAVTVMDVGSNPIPGVNVTFTAPGSGASGIFSNSTATIIVATNASGIASAPFTASATAGGPYTVTAAATSLTTVNFSMTNTQAAQAIAFGTNPGPLTFSPVGTFTVSATGGASANVVTFASTTTGVCTVSGSTVTMVSAGLCTITANQLGNANYTAAAQVSQNITISQATQTITFTSTPPAVVAAGGSAYTVSATATSGLAVAITIDAGSATVCSINGANIVSFLTNGTCIVDANQAGNGSYAAAAQKQQTIIVQNGVGPTVTAIGGFLADRNNAIVGNLWDMGSTIDRLNDAPDGAGPGAGLADQDQSTSQPRAVLGGHALASRDSQYGTAIPALAASPASPTGSADAYGLQQMVYSALRQLGETQSVSQLNYSGPFSAQMSTSGDMTGTFHTSLSQIMKWNEQAQQKEAASMGLNTSASAHANQFNPLDVWMQGTYAAVNSTQQSKFGLLSSGVDYVFNRNLLLGFYGQVDFMNQTTGLQAAGTGWMVGPYGTMRLSEQVFLEARGGYGHSANTMTDALTPTLTDQFGSTRWLASAALAGRWQFGDHIGFKPSFGFTYFTDSTDAYVNGLSVNVPSVTSQLGQFKLSPEVTKGFSLGDANWYEASLAPELIYNFTSTTADGLGSLDPTATGPQGLRGAIKWGVSMKTPTGLTITTQGSYDGIGSSGYSAVTASARVNVPLN